MGQTEPGLVALYDIRPGNGGGLFLQPRSLHRACVSDAVLLFWCKRFHCMKTPKWSRRNINHFVVLKDY